MYKYVAPPQWQAEDGLSSKCQFGFGILENCYLTFEICSIIAFIYHLPLQMIMILFWS